MLFLYLQPPSVLSATYLPTAYLPTGQYAPEFCVRYAVQLHSPSAHFIPRPFHLHLFVERLHLFHARHDA